MFFKSFLFIFLLMCEIFSQSIIEPQHPNIQYFGRVDKTSKDRVAFDWPGILIRTVFSGPSCNAIFEGVNCFDLFIDGKHIKTFSTTAKKQTYQLISGLSDGKHQLLISKRSESQNGATIFYGFILEKDHSLFPPPPMPEKKIEFIGDSYTVGYANEYLNRECPSGAEDSIIFAATNTYKAFGPIVARAFGAQYHIIAISGKGLVRNYNNIDKGKEILYYYDRTLITPVNNSTSPTWDFSQWKADVVVIGIGINDFQADPPYADPNKFDSVYISLIERIRKQYSGVKIICCATKVYPTDALIPRVKAIVEQQKSKGYKDVWYFEYTSENGALYGHPSIYDHQQIANNLIKVIVEATGWNRVDLRRGL
ncbi:MAG: GDSL-type esterase/lipase family protein [Chitinispirillaceae bacterium]|nr:GDSL-type esterase/lipase family protein [Chitinispirillaceae bacterium]